MSADVKTRRSCPVVEKPDIMAWGLQPNCTVLARYVDLRRTARPRGNHCACLVEAVGIEQPAAHSIPTILERFRGQVSPKTRSNNANKTRYRTFL